MIEAIQNHKVRSHRGQTLIMALGILFLLLFLGGVFVSEIGRNLNVAGRSRDTLSAQSLAEAGIQYCNNQLNSSVEGADWRPTPTEPITNAKVDPGGVTDPDYLWLALGFHRVAINGGRALVRVTYEPHTDDPRSQYIKIESVGRPGDLAGGLDPTIFVQSGNPPRLRSEQIAYKQIGLTDYLFFITNPDKLTTDNILGTPAADNDPTNSGTPGFRDMATILGDPAVTASSATVKNGVVTQTNTVLYGAPIRCNGPLRFAGDTYIYLSPRGSVAGSAEEVLTSSAFELAPTQLFNNAGGPPSNILGDNDLQVFVNAPLNSRPVAQAIRPSTDPLFSVLAVAGQGALVRDGSTQPDSKGATRGIPYLDPPRIDQRVDGSGVLRYRALTRDSGEFVGNVNTGQYGWGAGGIYVNNTTDLQPETKGTTGASSLRSEWLNPSTLLSNGNWTGPYYRPPGLQIDLRGNHIIMTRSDGQLFYPPAGPNSGSGVTTLDIPLDDVDRANYVFPGGTAINLAPLSREGDDPTSSPRPFGDPNSYGVNLVIMAEGNVRVKGAYGAITPNNGTAHVGRVHLTIVTGGTAYIEGNIVKNDGFGTTVANTTLERGSTCAILAKDYVCVNTTQFVAPIQPVIDGPVPGALVNYMQVSPDPGVTMGFSFGIAPTSYLTAGNQSSVYLLMQHATDSPGLLGMMNLNVNSQGGGVGEYIFNTGVPFHPETYALGVSYTPAALEDTAGYLDNPEGIGFPLVTAAGSVATLNIAPGLQNNLQFQQDANAPADPRDLTTTGNYYIAGAAVAPLDIRIEALLYAQDRSFFVIPGPSFNQNPADTRQNFQLTGIRPDYNGPNDPEKFYKDLFPFYNEPSDIRITVFGAISEAYTASLGDQAAWNAKWGYIPATMGSTGTAVIPDLHMFGHDGPLYNPGDAVSGLASMDNRTPSMQSENICSGIRYVYDPAFAMPFQNATDYLLTSSPTQRMSRALRLNAYHKTATSYFWLVADYAQYLPAVPRLPVCPGLLYSGTPDEPIENN